jgi:hypothetical protein
MDTLYHWEKHFRGGDTVKDIVIGMSDGLTVPFALAAGISGAISAAHIAVTAEYAEAMVRGGSQLLEHKKVTMEHTRMALGLATV